MARYGTFDAVVRLSGVDEQDLGELDEEQLRAVIEEWLDNLSAHASTLFGRTLTLTDDGDLYTATVGVVVAVAADMMAKAAQHRVQPTIRVSDFNVVSINTIEVIKRLESGLERLLARDEETQNAALEGGGLRLHMVGRPASAG